MYFIQKNHIKNILVYKSMPILEDSDEFVNLILSPEFFTFLKESFKIKFKHQAKQIAPSLFDELLEDNKEYCYSAYKNNDQWNFFAYNLDEILLFLKEKNIDINHIKKIFFSQEIVDYISPGKILNDSHMLLNIDDIVTIIPMNIMDDETIYEKLNLKDVIFKHGELAQVFHLDRLSNKLTIILSTIFLIFGIIFMAENSISKSIINDSYLALKELEDKNQILVSKIARDTIYQKYLKIDKKEKEKRQILKNISKIIPKKMNLTRLVMSEDEIVLSIELHNKMEIRRIKKNAKKFKFKFKQKKKNLIEIEKKI